ncbi:hypothetical protein ACLKMY_00605 [Paraburkholderia mimosarum]|uniref:hypothetical protein n=1 Tax=Paraburkholderia mimosarum TaxID=312026 RepID=UPI0039C2D61B
MSDEPARYFIELPIPAAAHLAMEAAKQNASLAEYLGYVVLKQLWGYAHPAVVAFESRPKYGQERKS